MESSYPNLPNNIQADSVLTAIGAVNNILQLCKTKACSDQRKNNLVTALNTFVKMFAVLQAGYTGNQVMASATAT